MYLTKFTQTEDKKVCFCMHEKKKIIKKKLNEIDGWCILVWMFSLNFSCSTSIVVINC